MGLRTKSVSTLSSLGFVKSRATQQCQPCRPEVAVLEARGGIGGVGHRTVSTRSRQRGVTGLRRGFSWRPQPSSGRASRRRASSSGGRWHDAWAKGWRHYCERRGHRKYTCTSCNECSGMRSRSFSCLLTLGLGTRQRGRRDPQPGYSRKPPRSVELRSPSDPLPGLTQIGIAVHFHAHFIPPREILPPTITASIDRNPACSDFGTSHGVLLGRQGKHAVRRNGETPVAALGDSSRFPRTCGQRGA